jgi:hypothetical protein
MSKVVTQNIGPPHTKFGGMNTTLRKQQVPPDQFNMLRNVDLSGETLTRRGGYCRVCAGARTAKSLKVVTSAANYVQIPYQDDSVDVDDFNLTDKFTVFVSYSLLSLSDDVVVASHSDDTIPPWRITHLTTGSIVATVAMKGGAESTCTTAASYTTLGREYTVALTRNGAAVSLVVNGGTAVAGIPVLTAAVGTPTLVSSEAIYLGGWSGLASGSTIVYYEFRLHRNVSTSWRVTQYPWSGRFGDPALACHLTFEEGTGTALTDYSRNNHSSITVTGGNTWLSTTKRQVSTMVTGIHCMENARGRKWLLVDIGPNHYRIPLN